MMALEAGLWGGGQAMSETLVKVIGGLTGGATECPLPLHCARVRWEGACLHRASPHCTPGLLAP